MLYKTIGILNVFYTSAPNLVVPFWMGDVLWCGQAQGLTHTDEQTDAGNNNTWRQRLASGKNPSLIFQHVSSCRLTILPQPKQTGLHKKCIEYDTCMSRFIYKHHSCAQRALYNSRLSVSLKTLIPRGALNQHSSSIQCSELLIIHSPMWRLSWANEITLHQMNREIFCVSKRKFFF